MPGYSYAPSGAGAAYMGMMGHLGPMRESRGPSPYGAASGGMYGGCAGIGTRSQSQSQSLIDVWPLISSQATTVVICKGTLTPPTTESPQTHLAAPAYLTLPLQKPEACNTHHELLTRPLPPAPRVPPAHRTRLEAAACSLLLLQETRVLSTRQDHLTLLRTLHALLALLPLLSVRALTRATTPRNRT
jgi:hypothetical protein